MLLLLYAMLLKRGPVAVGCCGGTKICFGYFEVFWVPTAKLAGTRHQHHVTYHLFAC
jgi:hypothetical protein